MLCKSAWEQWEGANDGLRVAPECSESLLLWQYGYCHIKIYDMYVKTLAEIFKDLHRDCHIVRGAALFLFSTAA